ncbi:MAG: hypothetical protein RR053_06875 [Evtepia sp.]
MANFNTLDELLNTTVGMEILRNNSANDDSIDTVIGVEWFKFNQVVASSVYASGNHWLGFGTNAEQLKVCRRDGKMYSLYRQVGTIKSLQFLKIRWEGFTWYSQTTDAYALKYEVFLFSDGGFYLNVVQAPTDAGYLGTSALVCGNNSYPFTITAGTPIAYSFYPQDTNGSTWTVVQERYPVIVNHVSSGTAIYTISGITLSKVVDSRIAWTEQKPPGTTLSVLSSLDGVTWSGCTNGGAVGAIASGATLTNETLKLKIELATTDMTETPTISALSFIVRAGNDANVVLLEMPPLSRFESAAGTITVNYDGTGNLQGEGGSVAAFAQAFTPTDLIPKPDQNDVEHIEVKNIAAVGTLTTINYSDTAVQDMGHIEVKAITATGVLTHIKNI